MTLEKPIDEKPIDNELLQALAEDVEGSFPQLVSTYHSQLLGFVVSQVKDPDLAEDVLQECWLRAYQALQRYSKEKIRSLELRAWLFTIVRNHMRTHLRKRTVRAKKARERS
jgi:RNA polymerase sigma-70 factor (ECF subfamily)